MDTVAGGGGRRDGAAVLVCGGQVAGVDAEGHLLPDRRLQEASASLMAWNSWAVRVAENSITE